MITQAAISGHNGDDSSESSITTNISVELGPEVKHLPKEQARKLISTTKVFLTKVLLQFVVSSDLFADNDIKMVLLHLSIFFFFLVHVYYFKNELRWFYRIKFNRCMHPNVWVLSLYAPKRRLDEVVKCVVDLILHVTIACKYLESYFWQHTFNFKLI